ncbi:MAG TPA: PDZ domain-containing protein [Acidimicrobiia bacterium]|jgi:putative serine protease PepD
MPSDEPDDEGAAGPPPHPLDRPWVHPTEMFARASSGRAGRPRVPGRSRGRDIALALGAGIVGALTMVAVLGIAGLLGGSDSAQSQSSAERNNETDAAERIAAVAGHSVVGLLAVTPFGTRRASGVVVAPGDLLTTTEAIEGATSMRVVDNNGGSRPASVLGKDDITGLVVLQFDSHGLDPASLASDDDVRSGTWIVAIGGGSGTGPFVTSGVVSSLGGWSDDGSGVSKPNLITTNTPMPDTARGGALLDSAGRLVGLLAGPVHGGAGALATPADMARSVLDQLADSGHVEHGELGIRATDDGGGGGGVRVSSVPTGSPAAKAKVEVGDVIVAVNAVRVPDSASLVYEVQRHRAGDEVTLSVTRGGKKLNLAVTLGRFTEEPGSATAATTTALSSAH